MDAAENVVSLYGEDGKKTPYQLNKHWEREKDAAQKRLNTFYKNGVKTIDRYLGKLNTENPNQAQDQLNLFHSNVTMMKSMLYGSIPKVDVAREHHDPDDDVARVACLMYQRILQADVDPSGSDFPTNLKAALLDRLLPGLGVCRVRYDYVAEMQAAIDPATMEIEEVEKLLDENAPIEYVHWQDFLWGWGRTWAEVPWVGFRAWMTKNECVERFGAEISKSLVYKEQSPFPKQMGGKSFTTEQKSFEEKAEIWEFWCKDTRTVYWWSPEQPMILDEIEDPLGLDGFFPIPQPLIANCTTTLWEPKADFVIAQDLYNEIDNLQQRIVHITRAIKVVGVYDESAGTSVARMLTEAAENQLIPVANWAMFAEGGGLDGKMQWFPVQEVAGVLQTLISLRDQAIENLYQVTGMSDIMRGGKTDQYTSDGTNQLKAKFGSVRIQAMQEEFARFASDLEALKAEVISKHFDPATIVRQSAAQFLPTPDRELVMPAVELMKSPEVKWRVDIRPESIAMIDYAAIKAERTEFLTTMATYIQSAQAAAREMPGALPLLLEMMKWGMSGFKGANYLEGIFDKAIDVASTPQPQQDQGPSEAELRLQTEQIRAQTAQQKTQGDLAKIEAKKQADLALTVQKIQGELQKINTDAGRDMTLEQYRAQQKLREIIAELDADLREISANRESDLAVEQAQAQYDLVLEDKRHENSMRQLAAQMRRQGRQGANSNG